MKWYQSKQNWIKFSGFCFFCLVLSGIFFLINFSYHNPKTIERNVQHSIVQEPQKIQTPAISQVSLQNALGSENAETTRFYEQRQWQPLWDDARLTTLVVQLKLLKGDGLNPAEYYLAELENHMDAHDDPKLVIARELLATRAYLLSLHHLYRGKTQPDHIDPALAFINQPVDTETFLTEARQFVEKNTIDSAFEQFRPNHPAYGKLRSTLTNLRRLAENGGWPAIPEGKVIKPGKSDPRIPLLRQRLEMAGLTEHPVEPLTDTAQTQHETYFDENLVNAVKRFQQFSYLKDDGIVGKSTFQMLNVPVEQRIDQVRANMERLRWRWPDYQVTGDYILVDIAAYRLAYMHEGKALWQTRIQVGKPSRPTPVLQSTINYITLNPQWSVPPTILRKDVLPAIRKDKTYLAEHNLHIFNNKGNELSAETIYWDEPGGITLRQDSGKNGALGQLAIRFPNEHSVYLHETPQQALFNEDERAFSSGCIRVENARELAVLLLNNEKKWNRAALETELDKGVTRNAGLTMKIPVIIHYFTADAAENGTIMFRKDIYHRDALIVKALDASPN